ncbi:tripartite motif-containing protein 59-like isoform X2 [Numida meleagris]|uniref:tripartite motif-containing protein 59-like isoform X2 n=1 Tax=Numida meleagris TaxID=8996 RepID=UPI000B3E239D|nr:tripartite motif-containing protein 59-like isoform X2 [Numida meleagris]
MARQPSRGKASRERPKPRSDWKTGLPISCLPQSPPGLSVPRLPLPGSTSWEVGGWSSGVAVSPGRMAAGPAEQGWRQRGEPGPAEMEPRPRSLVCSSQMEASLTCAVCLSLFEEPVTLPLCSHNFCRGCVLECLASAEAARLQQQQRGQGQARGARGGAGPGADGGDAAGARVSCPLCRKLCPLPRGGAAALPVNTTLAEVVRLYRSNAARAGSSCQKHPGRLLQLYCRMCRQAGCGQCVSEEHQGVFHSINLIDTVYQEEQLNFFSSLREMRIINEKLMNEISSPPNDTDMVLNNEAEIIALAFGEIFKTLEMKKQQLTEDLENQRRKKEKEFQIWKKMKETHKKTIENLLNDCEKLVHECDPQHFLEVACGLNTRMKTQLDLMNIASSYKKPPEYTQKKMDIKPVVNEILALKLMPVNVDINKDLLSGGSENSTENIIKQWQDQKNIPNTFLPVAGQEDALTDSGRICTRLMSISEMPVFQNMSHEELRYKYYMEHQKHNRFKIQTLPASKKYEFVAAEALKKMVLTKPKKKK